MGYELETSEMMPREDKAHYYVRELQRQILYAYENASAMRAKFDKVGVSPSDIHTLKDMEKIPITKKEDLIDLRRAYHPWGGLLAIPPEKLSRIYISPGPIYEPAHVARGVIRKTLRALGFVKGDLVVNAWSYHMVPAGHVWDEGLRDIGCAVIPMGTGNTELHVQVLNDLPVTGWVGPSGFLMNIITKAVAMGYDPKLDFSLRVAFAGGEMGGEEIRRILWEKYGVMALDSYGTADIGGIAYQCRERKLHIAEEVFVEIVDPDTGKQLGPGDKGEVLVTPLFEKIYPLIRFGTGDISAYSEEICSCGRTSVILRPVMGRLGEAVRVRGMLVYFRQISEVASKFREISRVQMLVRRPHFRDEMVIKAELADEPADREKLMAAFCEAFRDTCRVNVDQFEFVLKGSIPECAKLIMDERVY